MKVLNFGSLNVDYVYSVDHIVIGGETIPSSGRGVFAGGKGLNQSIALSKAGLEVWHAGCVGNDADGRMLMDTLERAGVHTELVGVNDGPCGHTIIQVDRNGQNSIILFGGQNRAISADYRRKTLSNFGAGDVIVLQNEINDVPSVIDEAWARGLRVVLNPSPFDDEIKKCDLSKVSVLFVNEIEGAQFCGTEDPDGICEYLSSKYPDMTVVLTLGGEGSRCVCGGKVYKQGIFKVTAVDTTAAGDTFEGFFLGSLLNGESVETALKMAAKASAIAVSRKGAADSIPAKDEVEL